MPFLRANLCNVFLSNVAIPFESSLHAPLKLVPLSLYITAGEPRLAANRCNAIMAELVVNECASSKCIALVVKQVKRTPHRFPAADRFLQALIQSSRRGNG